MMGHPVRAGARSTATSRWISASSPTPRTAPGWSSTATRTTRRRPTSARARRATSSPRVQPRLARDDDPRRRGVLRLRHRSRSRHAHPARRREPAHRRRADVLEGLRHGRPAHRLRRRPRRHDQEDARLGRRHAARARSTCSRLHAGTRRRRAGRERSSRPSARATPTSRDFTMKWFADRGMKPTDSQANFMFVNIGRPVKELPRRLPRQGRPRRARLPAVREDALPHLVRHDGRDEEGRRGVRRSAREEGRARRRASTRHTSFRVQPPHRASRISDGISWSMAAVPSSRIAKPVADDESAARSARGGSGPGPRAAP